MQNQLISGKRDNKAEFILRTFQENLQQRMDSEKLLNLKALGTDFFSLVDQLSRELFKNYRDSAPLLELSEDEYLWELQIFANQFLRHCAGSSMQLRSFCRQLHRNLDDSEFHMEFNRVLDQAFLDHFFTSESQAGFLA